MGLMGGKAPVAAPAAQEFDAKRFYMWVKALESKLNGLRREFELLKNNITRSNSEVKQEVSSINSDIVNFTHKQEKMMDNMNLIIKELKKTAGSEELDVLKRYVEFWNPMNFVTAQDVERLIDQKLLERNKSSSLSSEKKKTGK